MEHTQTPYERLAAIDVSAHLEKKNGLSYLSWAWAWDALKRQDPAAFYQYDEPKAFGDTLMVFCQVSAFGMAHTAHLPVMDHRNKAIVNPDAFAVNTAMQRALVKAIAMHGLGLYVYAGEDVPQTTAEVAEPDDPKYLEWLANFTDTAKEGVEELRSVYAAAPEAYRKRLAKPALDRIVAAAEKVSKQKVTA